MSVLASDQRRSGAWAPACVTVILAGSAAVAIGIGVLAALRLEDAEPLESAFILSVARQLSNSPWELYGPFGGRNLLVLIHAPLYYRLAALLAWPMARAGLDVVTAALAAGRSLSMSGLAVTLAAVYRLARLDGAPARAGWLAVFLFASAPVVGVFPFVVRPDMLGVTLQTTGVLLVLSVLLSERPRKTTLIAAFASFGLAICVKQHFLAGPLVSTCLLAAAWRRKEVALRSIERGLLTAFTLAFVVYATEELASGGRMSQAVFLAAANAAKVHPVDWSVTLNVLIAIIGQSSGLIGLLMASCLTLVPVGARLGRRAFVAAGTILVGPIFALAILPFVVATAWPVVYLFHAVFAAVLIILPACAFLEPRSLVRGRLDRALWFYLAAELALMLFLCHANAGAWVNYAIPSAVVVAVLTARVLDRALGSAIAYQRLIPIAVAASILPIGVVIVPYQSAEEHRNEALIIAQISQVLGRPASEFFFVGRPGDNRVRGRLDLVYDDWLYPVFESMQLAEPRSIWLRRALAAGPVRFVVNTSESPHIDGIGLALPQLGYARRLSAGPFFVWERIRRPTASSGRSNDWRPANGHPFFGIMLLKQFRAGPSRGAR
jgi:hypothetical protein